MLATSEPVTVEAVRAALASKRFVYCNEKDLHVGIGHVLEAAFPGAVEREVPITKGSRLDFRVGAVVAVEVKIDGTLSELTRQVYRYAEIETLAGVVAVVGRARLRDLPDTMNGKPIAVVHLGGAL